MLHQRSNPYSVNLFEVIGLLRGSSARNDAIGLFQFSRFGQTFVEQTHRFARRILLGDAARRACALGFNIQRSNFARDGECLFVRRTLNAEDVVFRHGQFLCLKAFL